MKKNRFHVSSDGEHDLPMLGKDANTRVWEGDAQNVRIYGINAMPYIRKATVTLIKDNTTGIQASENQITKGLVIPKERTPCLETDSVYEDVDGKISPDTTSDKQGQKDTKRKRKLRKVTKFVPPSNK